MLPKRQLRVKGMDEMTNFHFTPSGSGRERKVRREESCSGPSMDFSEELAGRGADGVL